MEPRRAQIVAPLLNIAATDEARARIRAFANGQMRSTQGDGRDLERQVLSSVRSVLGDPSTPLTLGSVAKQFDEDWGKSYGIDVSPRWVGSILRRLGIRPQKSNGVFVIPTSEYPRVRELFAEQGLTDFREDRDGGDDPMVAASSVDGATE